MGAGKGWSQTETKTACRAYIVISEDPRRGSGRKKEAFVATVLDEYKRLIQQLQRDDGLPHVDRTGDAICQRFRKARSECLKYESILAQIRNRKPTGSPSDDDINRAALAIYNGESTIGHMYTFLRGRTVDAGSEFPSKDAIEFLRSTHTWNMLLESRRDSLKSQLNASAIQHNETVRSSDELESELTSPLPTPAHQPTEVNADQTNKEADLSPIYREKEKRPVGKKKGLGAVHSRCCFAQGCCSN